MLTERRFIEKPLKPAPYQPVTTTVIRSTPVTPFKPGHSTVDKIPISERELHRVTVPDLPAPVVEEKPQEKPIQTIPDEPKPAPKKSKKGADGDAEKPAKDKKAIKKYGAKLDTAGSPSRSRSTTKELIRELPNATITTILLNIAHVFINADVLAAPDDATMGPPTFSQPLENDLTINDGDRLELTVKVEGDPEPQITWLKNEQVVTSSDVVDLRYKYGVASLTIQEVFPEDEGEYVCTATNSIGTISTTCKLKINRKFLSIAFALEALTKTA